MTRTYRSIALIALVAMLLSPTVWGKSPAEKSTFKFRLDTAVTVNGVELAPGNYRLELNGASEAVIFKGAAEVTRARVEVKARENASIGSSILRAADGRLLELRFSKTVVVFER
jgi:hypothetical protein